MRRTVGRSFGAVFFDGPYGLVRGDRSRGQHVGIGGFPRVEVGRMTTVGASLSVGQTNTSLTLEVPRCAAPRAASPSSFVNDDEAPHRIYIENKKRHGAAFRRAHGLRLLLRWRAPHSEPRRHRMRRNESVRPP
jgi:hypothetical protein